MIVMGTCLQYCHEGGREEANKQKCDNARTLYNLIHYVPNYGKSQVVQEVITIDESNLQSQRWDMENLAKVITIAIILISSIDSDQQNSISELQYAFPRGFPHDDVSAFGMLLTREITLGRIIRLW